jgi:hypothetical protein
MDLMIKLRSEVMRKSLLLKSVKIRQFHPFTFHPPPRRIHPSRAFTPPAPKHFFSPPTPSPVPSAVPFHPPHSSAPTRSGSRPPEASAFTPAPPSPGALPRCSSAAASQAPPFSRSGEIQAGARCREGEAGHGRRGGRAGRPDGAPREGGGGRLLPTRHSSVRLRPSRLCSMDMGLLFLIFPR